MELGGLVNNNNVFFFFLWSSVGCERNFKEKMLGDNGLGYGWASLLRPTFLFKLMWVWPMIFFQDGIKTLFVYWKVVFFFLKNEFREKWISRKWITGKYFPMFGSVMENKLENIFQCLVILWKMSWKITY
jgi:hypothetical protein